MASEADLLQKISKQAKSQGAIHHRFGIGDGFVVAIDEWESAAAFNGFFADNADIATAMQEGGAQGEPEVRVHNQSPISGEGGSCLIVSHCRPYTRDARLLYTQGIGRARRA
jgi:hypothetical protein